jgi:glycerophosphoryl diester phosphodiesterase
MIVVWIILAAVAGWIFMIAPRLRRPALLKELQKARFAHRGLHAISQGVPENSLKAFSLAVEQGYGIELDVHLSKDGVLVVEHDDSLLRTCGTDRAIEDCRWEEIKDLNLEGTEEKLPSLEQVFALVDGKIPLLIEAKAYRGNQAALAAAIHQALQGYSGDSCVESFDPRVLFWFRKNAPEVVRGQLSGYLLRHGAKVSKGVDFAMRHLLVNFLSRPDFIAYDHRDHRGISFRLCRAIFRPPVFFWTVKSVEGENLTKEKGATPIFEQILD